MDEMDEAKKKRLRAKGWEFGGAKDFLGLTEEEAAYIELKLALSRSLRERRSQRKITQARLAELIKSSQSRVAKMEAGDPSVSMDLLVRALLALGASRKDLVRAISPESPLPAA
jgi:predicted XRE-type DNA-binding protein